VLQFDLLQAFGAAYMPRAVGKLELYRGERPIFDLFGIEEEIARALARRVDLKSGGYLIIDQTEALTTVDVNTGGFVGARNFDDTIFKTNLEAAGAIARQLRLRNLGGIIIADFIDMAREDHQQAVLAEFRKQLARDRTRTTVSGFTQLGLVEMTRKRTRESLAHMLCEPCPTCQGRGQVKTARSVCYDILREILREARQFNPKEFRVIASASVVEMLLDEESVHLAGLSEFIGKPISLSAEPTMNPEQYDIVLDVGGHRAPVVLGQHEAACSVEHGVRVDHRRLRAHAAEDGGEGHVRRIAPGAQADQAHRDGGARRVEQIPAVTQVDLDVGVEVRWPEGRVGAEIGAGGKSCGDAERAAQRDHQVREVAADADLVDQRVHRRGVGVRGVRHEGDMGLHPVADRLYARMTLAQAAEGADGQPAQAVGLAVAARVEVADDLWRQPAHRHLGELRRVGEVVLQVQRGQVRQVQRAGLRAQPQVTVAGQGIGVDLRRHRLADRELLVADSLPRRVRGMHVEDEVGAIGVDLVVQFELEFDADHGGLSKDMADRPDSRGSEFIRGSLSAGRSPVRAGTRYHSRAAAALQGRRQTVTASTSISTR
jgi:hypothetical protein